MPLAELLMVPRLVGFDACDHLAKSGPYQVVKLTRNAGYLVIFFQEDEPIDPDEQADAWDRLERAFPALGATELVDMLEHHQDGRTLVIELFA